MARGDGHKPKDLQHSLTTTSWSAPRRFSVEAAEEDKPLVRWRVSLPARSPQQAKDREGRKEPEPGGESCAVKPRTTDSMQERGVLDVHPECSEFALGPPCSGPWWGTCNLSCSGVSARSTIGDTGNVDNFKSCCDSTAALPLSVNMAALILACRVFDDGQNKDSSSDITAVAARTQALRTALCDTRVLADYCCGGGGSAVPDITLGNYSDDGVAPNEACAASSAYVPTDGVPRDRREWMPTTRKLVVSGKQEAAAAGVPARPCGGNSDKQRRNRGPRKNNNTHNWRHHEALEHQPIESWATHLPVDDLLEPRGAASRWSTAPPRRPTPQSAHTPRPIWSVLRNRTLKITQEDPSIFRRDSHPRRAELVSGTKKLSRWHIMNRRVFGVREVPRRATTAVTHPDWLVFSGGVPPRKINERSRWNLRLGHARP